MTMVCLFSVSMANIDVLSRLLYSLNTLFLPYMAFLCASVVLAVLVPHKECKHNLSCCMVYCARWIGDTEFYKGHMY